MVKFEICRIYLHTFMQTEFLAFLILMSEKLMSPLYHVHLRLHLLHKPLEITHHHDESTRGVKMSRSKMKEKYILEMGLEWLEWCWPLGPSLIAVAMALCDKLREHMSLPFMCA